MLVLSRKKLESIIIGTDIVIKVLKIGSNYVKLGIEAPDGVTIVRAELNDEDGDSETDKPSAA